MRLIDADALDMFSYFKGFHISDYDSGWNGAVKIITRDIDDAPTIDAVPVVRCKDCKHRAEAFAPEVENGGGICMKMYETGKIEGYLCRVKADDFCSYGERREEDG